MFCGYARMLVYLYASFDLDLPTECDDEYWLSEDPETVFRQPPDKPSIISYLNCSLRLSQIASFAMRTIVRLACLLYLGVTLIG